MKEFYFTGNRLNKQSYLLTILLSFLLIAITVHYAMAEDATDTGWEQTFGGSDNGSGWSVRETTDGGLIIAGNTNSYGAGGSDVYLIKTDSNGNEQWYKTFGRSDYDTGWSVRETTDGGFIITGYTGSYDAAGGRDVYLIKTTPADGIDSDDTDSDGDDSDGTDSDELSIPSEGTFVLYDPIAEPILSASTDTAKPIGVGDGVLNGSSTIKGKIGIYSFDNAVDIYIVKIKTLETDSEGECINEISYLGEGETSWTTVVISDMPEISPWKVGIEEAIDKELFEDELGNVSTGYFLVANHTGSGFDCTESVPCAAWSTCAISDKDGSDSCHEILYNILFNMCYIDTAYFKVPDTGQTESYTDTWGEDSDYTINPISYTDNGDGTVTDNVTGLMWQQKDDDVEYTWYEASGTNDEKYNSDTKDVCGSLSLAGYNDWRLPSKKELVTIVDYGKESPVINESYFSKVKSSNYWSSVINMQMEENKHDYLNTRGITYAWSVNFRDGNTPSITAYYEEYVRCVRSEQDRPFNIFVISGNDTVKDESSGLMWQQKDDDIERTWEEAIEYCEGLSLDGFSDWRLPNVKELHSITDDEKYEPAIDENFFPDTKGVYFWYLPDENSAYWSSTGLHDSYEHAWAVFFETSSIYWRDNTGENAAGYVRCLRGGL